MLVLFVDGGFEFIKPAEFIGIGFRNNGVVWLEESFAGRREKMLRIEV